MKLLFTMVTELPCESMRFEADPDLEDVGDGLGAGHGCLGAGKAAGTGTWSGVRRGSGTGSGSVGSITGGSGGVGGACAGVDGEEGGVATIRNADAVMVRIKSDVEINVDWRGGGPKACRCEPPKNHCSH